VAFDYRRQRSSHLRSRRHDGELFDQSHRIRGADVTIHFDQTVDHFAKRRGNVRRDVRQ
jgi:hypothetical protein